MAALATGVVATPLALWYLAKVGLRPPPLRDTLGWESRPLPLLLRISWIRLRAVGLFVCPLVIYVACRHVLWSDYYYVGDHAGFFPPDPEEAQFQMVFGLSSALLLFVPPSNFAKAPLAFSTAA